MSQLQNITCRSCGLSGVIPASLLSLQAIQQLVLPHNQLSGGLLGPAVPPSKPPSLRLVDLSYNMLSQVPDFAFWNSSGAGLQRLLLRANAFPSSTPFSGRLFVVAGLTADTSTLCRTAHPSCSEHPHNKPPSVLLLLLLSLIHSLAAGCQQPDLCGPVQQRLCWHAATLLDDSSLQA